MNRNLFKSLFLLFFMTTGFWLSAQNTPFWLPENFPEVEVTGHSQNPEGYYFLNTFGILPTHDSAWLIIMDSTGLPVYYRMFHKIVHNFTLQQNTGTLTYWNWGDTTFYEMDSSYNIINSYRAENGYITDGHELVLMQDGSYWIMAEDPQVVDMSKIINGGDPNAVVIGFIIQHISQNGTVLFEWSSWNHFDILDADTNLVNLYGPKIDYVHGNALEIVDDSTILLSSRCLDEITKINTNTGKIVWRWGGKHNEFICTNDTVPFLAQHHIRYHGNNTYSLFDNGISGVREYSRAMVYTMDETARTVTVVKDLRKDSADFSRVMGSNQLLENGNYLVGWSFNHNKNVLSEFNTNGEVVFDIKSKDTLGLVSYRALKFPWHTNIFSFSADSIDFGTVETGKSVTEEVEITNHSTNTLVLNDWYVTDSAFNLASTLPVTIAPGLSETLEIRFEPQSSGFHSAAFSLFNTTDTTRFGRQIRVTGSADSTQFIAFRNADKTVPFPNPADRTVTFRIPANQRITAVTLISIDGKTVLTKKLFAPRQFTLDTSSLPDGMYIAVLQSNNKSVHARITVQHP